MVDTIDSAKFRQKENCARDNYKGLAECRGYQRERDQLNYSEEV